MAVGAGRRAGTGLAGLADRLAGRLAVLASLPARLAWPGQPDACAGPLIMPPGALPESFFDPLGSPGAQRDGALLMGSDFCLGVFDLLDSAIRPSHPAGFGTRLTVDMVAPLSTTLRFGIGWSH